MDTKKIIECAKSKFGAELHPYIEPVVKHLERMGRISEWEREGRDILREIQTHLCVARLQKEKEWEEEWGKGIDPLPIGFTISQKLHIKKFIKPEVEKLRESIFGRKTPPFSTLEEAVEWIEATHKKEQENWQKTRKDRDVNLRKELKRLSRLFNTEIGIKASILRYPHPKKGTGLIPVVQGGTLYKLQSKTEKLAKATFYNQATLVAYTLLDCELLPPRIRWTQHLHHRTQPIPALTLEIPRPITKKKWDKLYYEVVNPTFRGGEIPPKYEELYRLIKRLGGVPEKGKGMMKFWEKVCEEWKRQYPESRAFPTPDSVRMAYKRKIAPHEEKKKKGGDSK